MTILRKIGLGLVIGTLVIVDIFLITSLCKHYTPKKTTVLTFSTCPAKGTTLRYEDFRGYKVPIKADGQGGEYRFIGDVPWKEFTIEEKFDMARVGGGYLSESDIQEIARKYGKR